MWKRICFLFLQCFSIEENAFWEPCRRFDSAEVAENVQGKAESVVCLFYYVNPIDFLLLYYYLLLNKRKATGLLLQVIYPSHIQ